ncbi:hypothetical protein [Cupriavidus necator]|uniref:hypothetical protein n=1 Tax=Cupriavidus necator TaxID=106590 RepID=UPI003F73A6C8
MTSDVKAYFKGRLAALQRYNGSAVSNWWVVSLLAAMANGYFSIGLIPGKALIALQLPLLRLLRGLPRCREWSLCVTTLRKLDEVFVSGNNLVGFHQIG